MSTENDNSSRTDVETGVTQRENDITNLGRSQSENTSYNYRGKDSI